MEIKEYQRMYQLEESYWWWVGRRELIKATLGRLNLTSPTILDVGCGTGVNLDYLSHHGAVIGLDSSNEAIGFCKMRGSINIILGDAENLPFRVNSFDLITALDLLEHIDDNMGLREFHRVLKPNGHLVLTVPAFNFIWSRHDEAVHHKRRYTKRQLKYVLETNGFIIDHSSYWNFFLFMPITVIRLAKRSLGNQKVETDVAELPSIVNRSLALILRIESRLIQHVDLPVGVSLVCVARVLK